MPAIGAYSWLRSGSLRRISSACGGGASLDGRYGEAGRDWDWQGSGCSCGGAWRGKATGVWSACGRFVAQGRPGGLSNPVKRICKQENGDCGEGGRCGLPQTFKELVTYLLDNGKHPGLRIVISVSSDALRTNELVSAVDAPTSFLLIFPERWLQKSEGNSPGRPCPSTHRPGTPS